MCVCVPMQICVRLCRTECLVYLNVYAHASVCRGSLVLLFVVGRGGGCWLVGVRRGEGGVARGGG